MAVGMLATFAGDLPYIHIPAVYAPPVAHPCRRQGVPPCCLAWRLAAWLAQAQHEPGRGAGCLAGPPARWMCTTCSVQATGTEHTLHIITVDWMMTVAAVSCWLVNCPRLDRPQPSVGCLRPPAVSCTPSALSHLLPLRAAMLDMCASLLGLYVCCPCPIQA